MTTHKIRIWVPYGRVVEFRKWRQAHPHIVQQVKLGAWEGYHEGPFHARIHDVYCTEERYCAFVRLAWSAR